MPMHARMPTLDGDAAVAVPLLAHTRDDSLGSLSGGGGGGGPEQRTPLGRTSMGRPASLARVGSTTTTGSDDVSNSDAARIAMAVSVPRPMSSRSSRLGSGARVSSVSSVSSASSLRRASSGAALPLPGQQHSLHVDKLPLPSLPSVPPDEDTVSSGHGSVEDTVGHGSAS